MQDTAPMDQRIHMLSTELVKLAHEDYTRVKPQLSGGDDPTVFTDAMEVLLVCVVSVCIATGKSIDQTLNAAQVAEVLNASFRDICELKDVGSSH